MLKVKETGLTKVGWFQFGVRKTFKISLSAAWDFLLSPQGVEIWLGSLKGKDLEQNEPFKTEEGIEGKITVLKPHSHIRMAWKRRGWSNTSIVQVRVIEAKTGTTISFHQEKLLNKKQREEVQKYWDKVVEEFTGKIAEQE